MVTGIDSFTLSFLLYERKKGQRFPYLSLAGAADFWTFD